MRVLFLTHSFPRHDGDAAGSFVLRLATALISEGVSVRVLAPSAPGLDARDVLDGVEVERFRYAPRRMESLAYAGNMASQVRDSWGARLALLGMFGAEFASTLRAIRGYKPDIVHAHWWFPNALVGGAACRLAGVPIVTTFHGSDVRLARSVKASHPILKHVMERSAAVTAVSSWLAVEAQSIGKGAMPFVAPMPAETDLFTPDGRAWGSNRLLFVGRLTRQKGVNLLLRALVLLPSVIRLDIVGDGEERLALEQLATTLGVDARVTWHGAKPVTELPAFYRSAAALVVPSAEEGLGLVAVEAQLCETPVVAFASGGLTDVIEDGRTGILVTQRTPEALAEAVTSLLASPDRCIAIGAEGRAVALARFSPQVAARRYLDIYQTALERPPR